jgi:hypothetical protein
MRTGVQPRRDLKVGGGVEIPVSSNAHLTGDFRYVFQDYDFSDIPDSDNLKNDFYIITVGLMFGL